MDGTGFRNTEHFDKLMLKGYSVKVPKIFVRYIDLTGCVQRYCHYIAVFDSILLGFRLMAKFYGRLTENSFTLGRVLSANIFCSFELQLLYIHIRTTLHNRRLHCVYTLRVRYIIWTVSISTHHEW